MKEIAANNTANEAHTTPAIIPALSSLLLLCLKFWILSQFGWTCTFRGSDSSPCTSSRLIVLWETPRTLISYTVSTVRFGISICNIHNSKLPFITSFLEPHIWHNFCCPEQMYRILFCNSKRGHILDSRNTRNYFLFTSIVRGKA